MLTEEPFVGFMPNDVREWLQTHTSEQEMAVAFAHVDNQTSRLMCAGQDDDDYWIDYAFEEWYELAKEVEGKIQSVLIARGEQPASNCGGHYILIPFMARHGFRDGSGWWIPLEDS